jgi:hypothetical protein
VGLIARKIEAQGIPTLCLTSALSITQAVNPARALFLDYPLGHTAGKPDQPELQDSIIEAALRAFETMESTGSVDRLPFHWAEDDSWKDSVMRPRPGGEAGHSDDRSERSGDPQYQLESDRQAAEQARR